jgi:hypothetical protein
MVLAFCVIPCGDGAPVAKELAKVELRPSQPQHNDQDHNDACSPFCNCSCCAGFSVVAKLSAAQIPVVSFQPTYISYIPAQLYSISLPVWQPPQLA